MKLHFEKPKSKLLSEYIEGYYFFINEEENFNFAYYTFPNNFQIVSVLLNNEIGKTNNSVQVTGSSNTTFTSNLTYHYKTPIKIQYSGVVKELTIYFKPLGLNKFVPHLSNYFEKRENFTTFIPFEDYEDALTEILNTKSIEIASQNLEDYLILKYDSEKLKFIEDLVCDIEFNDITVLADRYNISRQYINKLFHQHLGKSPADFKRIQRFRKSIQSSEPKLIHKGLAAQFYDQSHFIREIKKITNQTPKSFFSQTDLLTSNPWLII